MEMSQTKYTRPKSKAALIYLNSQKGKAQWLGLQKQYFKSNLAAK